MAAARQRQRLAPALGLPPALPVQRPALLRLWQGAQQSAQACCCQVLPESPRLGLLLVLARLLWWQLLVLRLSSLHRPALAAEQEHQQPWHQLLPQQQVAAQQPGDHDCLVSAVLQPPPGLLLLPPQVLQVLLLLRQLLGRARLPKQALPALLRLAAPSAPSSAAQGLQVRCRWAAWEAPRSRWEAP
jgi:hypothetical protein